MLLGLWATLREWSRYGNAKAAALSIKTFPASVRYIQELIYQRLLIDL
ncbi:hypothetical protein [Moorena sp. SIO4G3]|nr:hypothetical protein [Moorena sp. SIO4G3]